MRVVALVRSGRSLTIGAALGDLSAVAMLPAAAAREALDRARAVGARRAVSVWGDLLGEIDYFGAALVLSAVARRIGFDVIVTGEGRGAIGPAVAECLALPHLSGVVDARVAGDRIVALRLRRGQLQEWGAAAPVVLSCLGGPGGPGTAPSPDQPPDEALELATIGISPGELRWRTRLRPRHAGASMVRPLARPLVLPSVASLAERLRDEGLLALEAPCRT